LYIFIAFLHPYIHELFLPHFSLLLYILYSDLTENSYLWRETYVWNSSY